MSETKFDPYDLTAQQRSQLDAAAPDLHELLRIAEQLADIADSWDLGTDGKVEIDGEWVSCSELRQRFRDGLAQARGESSAGNGGG